MPPRGRTGAVGHALVTLEKLRRVGKAASGGNDSQPRTNPPLARGCRQPGTLYSPLFQQQLTQCMFHMHLGTALAQPGHHAVNQPRPAATVGGVGSRPDRASTGRAVFRQMRRVIRRWPHAAGQLELHQAAGTHGLQLLDRTITIAIERFQQGIARRIETEAGVIVEETFRVGIVHHIAQAVALRVALAAGPQPGVVGNPGDATGHARGAARGNRLVHQHHLRTPCHSCYRRGTARRPGADYQHIHLTVVGGSRIAAVAGHRRRHTQCASPGQCRRCAQEIPAPPTCSVAVCHPVSPVCYYAAHRALRTRCY